MSRPHYRKGCSTRGKTAPASTVTLNAERVRKVDGKTSRSGSARPAIERKPSVEHRKSEENPPNCVPSKARNVNVPMHDSSNNLTPQPAQRAPHSPIKGEGQYTDRFGNVIPVTIDLEPIIPTTISNNTTLIQNTNNEPERESGDISGTMTNINTMGRPKINEVCCNFLDFRCQWGNRCNRLHPKELLKLRSRICRNFIMGQCRIDYCNRIHPSCRGAKPSDAIVSESNPLHTTEIADTKGVPTKIEGEDDTVDGIIGAKTLKSVAADSKNNDVPAEIRHAPQPLTAGFNESHLETQSLAAKDLKLPPRSKAICRKYLIDRCEWDNRCHRFHPPEAERLQLLEVERSRPKFKEVCPLFLRGRCPWGVLCNYTHVRPDDTKHDESTTSSKTCPIQGTENPSETVQSLFASADIKIELPSIPTSKTTAVSCDVSDNNHSRDVGDCPVQLLPSTSLSSVIVTPRRGAEEIQNSAPSSNTPNDAPGADGVGQTHKILPRFTGSRPRKVCWRYLNGTNHNRRLCSYSHSPLDRTQNLSVDKQADKAISVDDEESPDSDSDMSSVQNGSFSRSLVDASSTTDVPLVNIPKGSRPLKKGSRCKKKRVPEKVSPSSAPIPPEETMAVCNGHSLVDVPTFTEVPAGNEVVNLPSLQKQSTSLTAFGGGYNYVTEQPNGATPTNGTQLPSSNLFAFAAEPFSSITTSVSHTTAGGTPPTELCRDWIYQRRLRGETCKYMHVNQPGSNNLYNQINKLIEGNFAKIQTPASTKVWERDKCDSVLPAPPDSREPPSHITVTVLEHTKINLGAGFEIKDVTTGFESRWVILGNLPSNISEKAIRRTLKLFGQVDDLRMSVSSSSSPATIKALFSSSAEALQAAGALNGAELFSRTISARLPLNNTTRGNGTFQDCSVRIEWDVPGRTGYAGYPGLAEAEAAVARADGITLRDSYVTATIYEGLPSLGAVNVQFAGLPSTAEARDLEHFGAPESVMLERPNYMSVGIAAKAIQGLLKEVGEVLSFELPPPPYRDRIVRAWAHFTSPTLAETASAHLNGRRPYFIGKGKLSARHVRALSYTLPADAYDKLASDVACLRNLFWRQGRGAVLSVVDRRAFRQQHDSSMPVFIKLSGEDVGALGHLKAEFEKLLHGEILMDDSKVIWDGFFERSAGTAFLFEIERTHLGVSIQKSIGRRTITLFGPISKRQNARRLILNKINHIRAQQTREIPLAGRLIGHFMSVELMELQQNLGHENVVLNLLRRTLTIRGNDAAYEAAQRAVYEVQKRHPEDRKGDIVECPVCFNQVVTPITLECGHSWCKTCLSNYFVAAIDNKMFPLRCLGAEATCSQPIPVAIARDILCANEFDAVVNASFRAYIYAHSDEFHYCPTPDCPQIYRSSPPDTILQCPSCLSRICPSCHVEAHEGLTCAVRDVDGDKLFKEWVDSHGAKNCPGCKAVIERTEGCNHMTCTQCQTHICWVCMETFPKGEGIYEHMRMAHGSIGL